MSGVHMESTRRNVLKALAAIGITGPLATDLAAQTRTLVSIENLRNAASLRGENFSEDRLRVIQGALQRNLDQFQLVRDLDIDDLVEPAPVFLPTRYDGKRT